MDLFKVRQTMERLDRMIDNAIEGNPIEEGFDETKMSALETKLSHYLAMNNASKAQLAEEKGKINALISDISHQTKTPLSNIMLHTQLLSERMATEDNQHILNVLNQQVDKLNFLITSLVKSSRLEIGTITVTPKKYALNDLLERVFQNVEPMAQRKGITFSKCHTEIEALFDMAWTAEAILNIADNAVKYTASGGTITISAKAYNLFCRIDITDTGIGISEEEFTHVFSRFYRSKRVTNQEGVGIGLYLARKIITSQGGYIKLKSSLKQGSTFSVFLPMGTQ